MSWFQIKTKPGKKPLRLLVLAVVVAFVLTACGTSKYEAVDLSAAGISAVGAVSAAASDAADSSESSEGAGTVADSGEMARIVIGETSGSGEESGENQPGDAAEGAEGIDSNEDVLTYQETDDYIIVLTDKLNVRAADNTTARIYIQLPEGEILHRTGYNAEWCRIEYDGGEAYVAADMVELTERPVTEETLASNLETAIAGAEFGNSDGDNLAAVSETSCENITPADGIPVYEKTGTVQEETLAVPLNGHVVAIDAGHQAKANAEKEPIGPGSQTKKAKMPESATGTSTGVKEYELTLTVAKKLKAELQARGYEVVMVRESHDVNLSNAERSVIANNSDAEIFIRLHANSMDNSGVYGAMAMCMTEHNPYNSELSADSYNLSKKIINNICSLTGTKNRGVQKVDNSSAINWCQIPVSVVEMGFLTNPDEDRWLQNDDYQNKIVTGITSAVDSYFSEEN